MTTVSFKAFNTSICTMSVLSVTYPVGTCNTVGFTIEAISTCHATWRNKQRKLLDVDTGIELVLLRLWPLFISPISWRSDLLVAETGVLGENQWPVASHWQTWSHYVVSHWNIYRLQQGIQHMRVPDIFASDN
jgi:hypothetical protein